MLMGFKVKLAELRFVSFLGVLFASSHFAFATFIFDGGPDGSGVDFFNEVNWIDTNTDADPVADTIDPVTTAGFVGIASDLTIDGTFAVDGQTENIRLTDGFTLALEGEATLSSNVFSAPNDETANIALSDNTILTIAQNIARTAFDVSGDADVVFTGNSPEFTTDSLNLASNWTGTITLTQLTNRSLIGANGVGLFNTVTIDGMPATEADIIRENFTTDLGAVVGTIFRLVAGPPPPVEPPVAGTYVFDGGPDGSGVDFFDEANWLDNDSNADPPANSITPFSNTFAAITSNLTISGTFRVEGALETGNIRLTNGVTLTLEDEATLFSQVFSAPNNETFNVVLSDNAVLTVTQNIARAVFDTSGNAGIVFSGPAPQFTTDTLNLASNWTGTIMLTDAEAAALNLIGGNDVGLFDTVTIGGTPATETDFIRENITGALGEITGTVFRLSSELELYITQENTSLEFQWNSTSNMQYDIRSSTTLQGDPSTWDIYDDGTTVFENIAADASGTNILTGVNLVGSTRFFVVTEQ